jgi:hypothetical protein
MDPTTVQFLSRVVVLPPGQSSVDKPLRPNTMTLLASSKNRRFRVFSMEASGIKAFAIHRLRHSIALVLPLTPDPSPARGEGSDEDSLSRKGRGERRRLPLPQGARGATKTPSRARGEGRMFWLPLPRRERAGVRVMERWLVMLPLTPDPSPARGEGRRNKPSPLRARGEYGFLFFNSTTARGLPGGPAVRRRLRRRRK